MKFPIGPLVDVPAAVHDLMPPYLNLSTRLGVMNAETLSTAQPLPWSDELAEWAVSKAIYEFEQQIRSAMPTLPDVVITAMCRQMVSAFGDRLEEIHRAAGSTPQGGSA